MFPLPKGKPEFSKLEEAILKKGSTLGLVLLSVFFLAGCLRNQNIEQPLQISSCGELLENMKYFQQNCNQDADCMEVEDPGTFCYSETIHINKEDEYDALFKKLDCPIDKPGQNTRGDYCEINRKSTNYCNKSTGMCTPGIKNS